MFTERGRALRQEAAASEPRVPVVYLEWDGSPRRTGDMEPDVFLSPSHGNAELLATVETLHRKYRAGAPTIRTDTALGMQCKTEGCSGILPVRRDTPMPNHGKLIYPVIWSRRSRCGLCQREHVYSDRDVMPRQIN